MRGERSLGTSVKALTELHAESPASPTRFLSPPQAPKGRQDYPLYFTLFPCLVICRTSSLPFRAIPQNVFRDISGSGDGEQSTEIPAFRLNRCRREAGSLPGEPRTVAPPPALVWPRPLFAMTLTSIFWAPWFLLCAEKGCVSDCVACHRVNEGSGQDGDLQQSRGQRRGGGRWSQHPEWAGSVTALSFPPSPCLGFLLSEWEANEISIPVPSRCGGDRPSQAVHFTYIKSSALDYPNTDRWCGRGRAVSSQPRFPLTLGHSGRAFPVVGVWPEENGPMQCARQWQASLQTWRRLRCRSSLSLWLVAEGLACPQPGQLCRPGDFGNVMTFLLS